MLVCLLLARSMDLITTYMVTPDLRLEVNPLVRWLGWRWWIVVNVLVCLWVSSSRPVACIIIIGSVLVAGWNYLLIEK